MRRGTIWIGALVLVLVAATAVAATRPADGDRTPRSESARQTMSDPGSASPRPDQDLRTVWRTDFDDVEIDGEGFSSPTGSNHGDCRREVRDGKARYLWVDSDSDGDPTRCYPAHAFSEEVDDEWVDPVRAPWVFSGRYRVSMDDPERLSEDGFLSLITVQSASPQDDEERDNRWTSVVTVNVVWDAERETTALNIYHVPGDDEGDYRQVGVARFPLEEWVDITIEWDADNRIRVYQDGELLITARKDSGMDDLEVPDGELHGLHAGGYASADITGWEIRNDDLRVRVLEDGDGEDEEA